MNKILSVLAVFSLAIFLLAFVSADTALTGVVGDNIVFTITEDLDFGNIEYGANVTDSGTDIVIDTTGSDTASNVVHIDTNITGTDSAFFSGLLEFEDSTNPGIWTNLGSMGTIDVTERTSRTFHTQLNGDTTTYGPGAKTATITYTVTG